MVNKNIFKRKTIFEVDYNDFENFVTSIYGGNLEIVANEEKNNNSSIQCDVPVKYLLEEKEIDSSIRQGNYPMWSISNIFKCLYEDGHLEEGEYLINISW